MITEMSDNVDTDVMMEALGNEIELVTSTGNEILGDIDEDVLYVCESERKLLIRNVSDWVDVVVVV